MYEPHFVYSYVDGHLGCYYHLATVNNASKNMSIQIFVQILLFFPLDVYLGVELLGHMLTLYLIC